MGGRERRAAAGQRASQSSDASPGPSSSTTKSRRPSANANAGHDHGHGHAHAGKRRRSRSAPASPNISELSDSRMTARPRRNTRTQSSSSPSQQPMSDPGGGSVADGAESDYTEESAESMSHWTYELVVVQHPQRARACGFGDKDRRPLSPPPIIRLYVRTSTGEEVDPVRVNIAFLVLLVDLWSSDGDHQRNIVMHPASTRPLTPPPRPEPVIRSYEDEPGPSSRPTTANSRPTTAYQTSFSPGMQAPGWRLTSQTSPPGLFSQDPSPHSRIPHEQMPNPLPVPLSPYATASIPQPRPHISRASSYTSRPPMVYPDAPRPFTAPSRTSPAVPPFNLPSLSSITENSRSSEIPRLTLPAMRDPRDRPSTATSHSSGNPSVYTDVTHPTDYSFNRSSGSTWNSSSLSSMDERDRHMGLGFYHPPPSPGWHGSPISPGYTGPITPLGETAPGTAAGPLSPIRDEDEALHGPSYSRVLVGSLCATCLRLQDENGEQGLFFFAYDLGIRTEGTFRLKFSLSCITSLLVPDVRSGRGAPLLADVYSDPFTVYSAKRFPGVVPTTNLTKLFAGQNVRLPTRQRKTKGDEEEEED